MSKERPIYLDNAAFLGLPITAVTSIFHRASGIVIFVAIPILLWMLSCSLESEASFNELKALLEGFFPRLVLWGIVSAFTFHFVAGIKHLIMDMGIGETLEGGRTGAVITLSVSAVLILLAGVWICLPM